MSDNALEFNSNLIKKLCEFYHIKTVNIVAHKPSSNGLVERTNRKMIEILRTLVAPKTVDWDLCLDDIQLAINNTVNQATGETPHFILYGVERRLPFTLLDDSSPSASYGSYDNYVSFRTRQAWEIIKKTRDMLKVSNKNYKLKYDKLSQQPNPKVGQKAYVLRPFKEGPLYKASKKFEGPYRIVEILKLHKCRMRDLSTLKERVEHVNNLKLINFDVDYSFVKSFDTSSKGDLPTLPLQDEAAASPGPYMLRSRAHQGR